MGMASNTNIRISQTLARKLVCIYGQRLGKGSTRISSDISIIVPDIGWFVSKDDLDKWFRRKNNLGDKKFEAICSFIINNRFCEVVPEAKRYINMQESAIETGMHLQPLYCNPMEPVDYDTDQYFGYWKIIHGESFNEVLPFPMHRSYFFWVKRIKGQNFGIGHFYCTYSKNSSFFPHTSGYVYFLPEKKILFKGFIRTNRQEVTIEMYDSDDTANSAFWLMEDNLEPNELNDIYDFDYSPEGKARCFFDKVEWSVIKQWD